jgi:large subunit ribosomal protein L10
MPTAEKEKAVQQARDWAEKSVGMVFTDYRGLKVKEMQQLRTQLRAKGGELHVVKNTLFRLAAPDVAGKLPAEMHNGPTAIAYFHRNESECAKVLFDYAVSSKTLVLKGGFINGALMDAKAIEALAKLPSRDVLIAQVIGAISAPLTQLVGVVDALLAQPVRTIYAVAEKLGAEPSEAASGPAQQGAEATPEPEAPKLEAAEFAESTEAPASPETAPTVEAAEDSAPEEPTN